MGNSTEPLWNYHGSTSDWETMEYAANLCARLAAAEAHVVFRASHAGSLFEYAASAEKRGIEVVLPARARGASAGHGCGENGAAGAGSAS